MKLITLSFILIVLGFLIAMVATLIPLFIVISNNSRIDINVGGCILVFFVPICFGYGTTPLHLIMIILLLVIVIVLITIGLNIFIRMKNTLNRMYEEKEFV